MALKPHGKTCQIKEQIIEDQATGLTLKFSSPYGGKFGLGCKLTIYGSFEFGNRDFIFSDNGT